MRPIPTLLLAAIPRRFTSPRPIHSARAGPHPRPRHLPPAHRDQHHRLRRLRHQSSRCHARPPPRRRLPAADLTLIGPDTPPENKGRKANLVARYRARPGSTLKPVLFISHLDVVEANRADWTTDPFVFTEKTATSTVAAPRI